MATYMALVARIWGFIFEKLGNLTGANIQFTLASILALLFDRVVK